jgi:hypothetical protein
MSEALTLELGNYLDVGIDETDKIIPREITSVKSNKDVNEIIEPKSIIEINNELGTSFVNISSLEIPIEILKKKTRELVISSLADKEETIIEERKKLILKEYSGGLTKNEKLKVKYYSWLLDRIEDAQNGEILDHFEKLVKQQETIADNVISNINIINKAIKNIGK